MIDFAPDRRSLSRCRRWSQNRVWGGRL